MARGKHPGLPHLAHLVAHLRAPPKLTLPHITSLRLTLASRNDHFGARCAPCPSRVRFIEQNFRHFLKEQLPRIRFANPNLEIHVRKFSKRPKDEWRPELEVSFGPSLLHIPFTTLILTRPRQNTNPEPPWQMVYCNSARTNGVVELPIMGALEG